MDFAVAWLVFEGEDVLAWFGAIVGMLLLLTAVVVVVDDTVVADDAVVVVGKGFAQTLYPLAATHFERTKFVRIWHGVGSWLSSTITASQA